MTPQTALLSSWQHHTIYPHPRVQEGFAPTKMQCSFLSTASGKEFIFVSFSGLCTLPAMLTHCSKYQTTCSVKKTQSWSITFNSLLGRQISLHKQRGSLDHSQVQLYIQCLAQQLVALFLYLFTEKSYQISHNKTPARVQKLTQYRQLIQLGNIPYHQVYTEAVLLIV